MKDTPTFDNPPAAPTCRQRRIVAFPACPPREPPASNARSNSRAPLLSAQEVLHRTLFASLYLLVRLCGDCRIAAGVRLERNLHSRKLLRGHLRDVLRRIVQKFPEPRRRLAHRAFEHPSHVALIREARCQSQIVQRRPPPRHLRTRKLYPQTVYVVAHRTAIFSSEHARQVNRMHVQFPRNSFQRDWSAKRRTEQLRCPVQPQRRRAFAADTRLPTPLHHFGAKFFNLKRVQNPRPKFLVEPNAEPGCFRSTKVGGKF